MNEQARQAYGWNPVAHANLNPGNHGPPGGYGPPNGHGQGYDGGRGGELPFHRPRGRGAGGRGR